MYTVDLRSIFFLLSYKMNLIPPLYCNTLITFCTKLQTGRLLSFSSYMYSFWATLCMQKGIILKLLALEKAKERVRARFQAHLKSSIGQCQNILLAWECYLVRPSCHEWKIFIVSSLLLLLLGASMLVLYLSKISLKNQPCGVV